MDKVAASTLDSQLARRTLLNCLGSQGMPAEKVTSSPCLIRSKPSFAVYLRPSSWPAKPHQLSYTIMVVTEMIADPLNVSAHNQFAICATYVNSLWCVR